MHTQTGISEVVVGLLFVRGEHCPLDGLSLPLLVARGARGLFVDQRLHCRLRSPGGSDRLLPGPRMRRGVDAAALRCRLQLQGVARHYGAASTLRCAAGGFALHSLAGERLVATVQPVGGVAEADELRLGNGRTAELAVALVPAEVFRTLERLAAKDRQEKGPGCCPVLVPEPVALFALDGAGSCCSCQVLQLVPKRRSLCLQEFLVFLSHSNTTHRCNSQRTCPRHTDSTTHSPNKNTKRRLG